jgi:hypothetical protein
MKNKKPEKERAYSEIKRTCEREFEFLRTSYEFEVIGESVDPWFYELLLKNRTTGIRLYYEVRDGLFFVYFCKLENGEYVRNPIVFSDVRFLSEYCLDDLLSIRASDSILPTIAEKFNVEGYEYLSIPINSQIGHKAKMLKMCGKDILTGDFSVFSALNRIVGARMRKCSPPKNKLEHRET